MKTWYLLSCARGSYILKAPVKHLPSTSLQLRPHLSLSLTTFPVPSIRTVQHLMAAAATTTELFLCLGCQGIGFRYF